MNKIETSVLIMMASFNGERFIKKQINSIIHQDFKNWRLIIQDDGSTDHTVEIIKKFCERDDRITLYYNDTDFHGPFINFHLLANKCKEIKKFDYYMFSDQDDLWDSDKISKLIAFTQKKESDDNKPLLSYADMRIIDANDKVTCSSIDTIYNNGNLNKYTVFFTHKISGCSLIMNQSCFFSVPKIDISNPMTPNLAHDALYVKFAAALGSLVYYPSDVMGYRRYGGNVTSKLVYKSGILRIIRRATHLKELAKDHAYTYRVSLYTIDLLQKKNLTPHQNEFLNSIKKIMSEGGFRTIHFFKTHQINFGKKIENISHILVLLLKLQRNYL